ncbi:MAG: hypothetical protein PHV34_20370 [Verrucomicrobiae bacterium]|nr:hypothetical protein [Verrucomicrobiae bacterium]
MNTNLLVELGPETVSNLVFQVGEKFHPAISIAFLSFGALGGLLLVLIWANRSHSI